MKPTFLLVLFTAVAQLAIPPARGQHAVAPGAQPTAGWTHRAPMPTARIAAGAAAFDGKLYVIGGAVIRDHAVVPLAVVEAYDPATGHWTRRADLPEPRQSSTTATLGGKIHLAGGTSALPDATASLLGQTPPALADTARPATAVPSAWKASVFPYATPRLAPEFLASIAPALRVDPIESLRTE